MVLDFETAYAKDYRILADGAEIFDGGGGLRASATRTSAERGQSPGVKTPAPLHVVHTLSLADCAPLRVLRLEIRRPARGWGVSLWEVGVFGEELPPA